MKRLLLLSILLLLSSFNAISKSYVGIDVSHHQGRILWDEVAKENIDLAFFPVDPRQGSMYDAGAGYFVMTVKPKIMIPMHFQGRGDVAMRFALTGENKHTKIIALETPGETIDLSIPDTDETAPDRKLKALLADESFGK